MTNAQWSFISMNIAPKPEQHRDTDEETLTGKQIIPVKYTVSLRFITSFE